MGKSTKCTVICVTKYGRCLQPKECSSVSEAIKYARSMKMEYRIFVDGNFYKRGNFQ